MRLNNKGFALTGMIYMLLVLFLMIMLLLLANLSQRKVVLDKICGEVKNKLEQSVFIDSQELPYQNQTSGIYYETLDMAFSKATDGDTIKVLRNVQEVSGATNSKGVDGSPIVLDLNGKTIDYVGDQSGANVIYNTGILELRDTIGGGKITTSTITEHGNLIRNAASSNFIFTSGKLEVAGSASANGIATNGEYVIINGGQVDVASTSDSGVFIANSFLKLNDGSIHSEGYGVHLSSGNAEINGGVINSNTKSAITNNSTSGTTVENPSVKITGGTISSSGSYGINNNANSMVSITGGEIYSTASHSIVNVGSINMTGGTVYAYNGRGISTSGSGNAVISGGTVIKDKNPITNQWVGGATIVVSDTANATITGNSVVRNEEGNGSNVIYNSGTGTLTVDGNATLENKTSVVGENTSFGKIVVNGGLLRSYGETVLLNSSSSSTSVNYGTIEVNGGVIETTGSLGIKDGTSYGRIIVTSGTIRATGLSQCYGIYSRYGTVTIGADDGSLSTSNPSIFGNTYGVKAVSGSINFYDGSVEGNNGSDSSISGTIYTPSGFTKKKALSGTSEVATLGWVTDGDDTLLVNDSSEYHVSRTSSDTSDKVIKQYPIYAPFAANQVYQLEFDMKGSGLMHTYFYGDANFWQVDQTIVLGGATTNGVDGVNSVQLPNTYTHREVRFVLKSSGNANVNKYLLFRINRSSGEADAYIKNIKFYRIN